jgi:hypothetical protein
MKRLAAIGMIALGFTGCGGNDDNTTEPPRQPRRPRALRAVCRPSSSRAWPLTLIARFAGWD